MPRQDDTLEFTLIENGLDFIAKAIEELAGDPTPRNLKYACLHLKSGTDLLLKERLRRHDWQQLFIDPDEADEQKFAEGAFVSPGTTGTIKRLRDEAGVRIRSRDTKALTRLRLLRNQLEHFTARDQVTAVKAVAAKTLGFTLDFVGEELEPDGLEGSADADLTAIRESLGEIAAFVDERWRQIRAELKQYDSVIDCYRCGEDAFVLDAGARCQFCGYQTDAETGAAEYAWLVLGSTEYDVTKGGEWAVSRCVNCSVEAMVDTGIVGAERPAIRWVCFSCGDRWDDSALSSCSRCGALHEGEMDVCGDCFEYMISGPD